MLHEPPQGCIKEPPGRIQFEVSVIRYAFRCHAMQSTKKCNILVKEVETYYTTPAKFSCSSMSGNQLVISASIATPYQVKIDTIFIIQ